MNDKYELTDITIEHKGRTLYRIRALKNLPALGNDIKAGTLGGFVESEANLSYDDRDGCWIYGDAKVYDNAKVQGWARVAENAEVYNNAVIDDFAVVGGHAQIGGNTVVRYSDRISDNGIIRKTPTKVFRMMKNGELQ